MALSRPTWDKSMETGHPDIDRQHEGIIDLVDELEAAEDILDLTGARNLLVNVMDFTVKHFIMEEHLMSAVHYPPDVTQEMVEQHREFTAYARLRVIEFSRADAGSALPLGGFLREWLVEHEFGLDRKLVEWIQEQQRGADGAASV